MKYMPLTTRVERELYNNFRYTLNKYADKAVDRVLTPSNWHKELCKEDITLRDLAESGKIDQYHEVLILKGLSYKNYIEEQSVSPTLISLVRRVMPSLIANELVGVQPMTGPTGSLFDLKEKFDDGTGINEHTLESIQQQIESDESDKW